jgi:alginate O-acetyltransferase complex protein AlgI
MLFTSLTFLFIFLPIVVLINTVIKAKYSNFWLLLCSLFFYVWGEPIYFWVMFFVIIYNFFAGILITKSDQKSRKLILVISIIINFGFLVFFKYYNFLISNLNSLNFVEIPLISNPHLPVGISFFIFHVITYIVDLYRKKVKEPFTSLTKLSLYVTLFPQLIAGPVVQYNEIVEQINSNRKITFAKFNKGLVEFIFGLGKKVIIANNIALLADSVFDSADITSLPSITILIAVLAYSLQIYFDFSGYTQMAIGLGKMLGFDLPENFNYPYFSRSIQDFWQRWHITLGRWFRDYVYIPLGGNRVSEIKVYRNIFIVFLLTGFWHGASWSFVLWGVANGLLIIFEKLFLGKYLQRFRLFSHIYSIFSIGMLWIMFRANNLLDAKKIYLKIFDFSNYINSEVKIQQIINNEQFLILTIALILAFPILPYLIKKFNFIKNTNVSLIILNFRNIFAISILFISLVYIVQNTYNPFIYFRF